MPDFIANAGGVICVSIEFHGGSEASAFESIGNRIRRNTEQVLGHSRDAWILPRRAATDLARERVLEASGYRQR